MMARLRMPAFRGPLAQARRCATLGTMPAPPRKLKDQVEDDLDHYASQRWPQLEEVTIRWRGSYGYVEGYVTEDDGIPLCRIGYLGSPDDWGFAIYQASTETYQESSLTAAARPGRRKKPSTAPAASTWPTPAPGHEPSKDQCGAALDGSNRPPRSNIS